MEQKNVNQELWSSAAVNSTLTNKEWQIANSLFRPFSPGPYDGRASVVTHSSQGNISRRNIHFPCVIHFHLCLTLLINSTNSLFRCRPDSHDAGADPKVPPVQEHFQWERTGSAVRCRVAGRLAPADPKGTVPEAAGHPQHHPGCSVLSVPAEGAMFKLARSHHRGILGENINGLHYRRS